MKKKYIGKTDKLSLINGEIYEILDVSRGWYRIVDERGEDYLYLPDFFVDENKEGNMDSTPSDFIRNHMLGEITNIEIID